MTIFIVADQHTHVMNRLKLKYLGFHSKEEALEYYEKTTDWFGIGILEVEITGNVYKNS